MAVIFFCVLRVLAFIHAHTIRKRAEKRESPFFQSFIRTRFHDIQLPGMRDERRFLKARCYDRRVDWERRLAREWPFFHKLFEENGARRVLDCSCGTGRHALLFSRNGYSVRGSDIDEGMITLARENASEAGEHVLFTRAAFSELARRFEDERFDAVLSTGNSLGQLDDFHELNTALKNMASLLAPGGILILHILNYARLIEKKVEHLPVRHTRTEEGERFFLKTFRYAEPWILVEFHDIEGCEGEWSRHDHTGKLLPILPSHLRRAIEETGLAVEGEFGDYSFSPFDIKESRDYITVSKLNQKKINST